MFPVLDAPATQMLHWLRVVILRSCAACNYGFWRLHEMTHTMLIQIHECNSFLTQVAFSSSKGLCSPTHDRANRATLICAAKAYTTEYSNKCAHSKAIEKKTNP